METSPREITLTSDPFDPFVCANSVNPDEMVCNEPSHEDLHCLLYFFYLFILDWNPLLYQWTCPNSMLEESTSKTVDVKG